MYCLWFCKTPHPNREKQMSRLALATILCLVLGMASLQANAIPVNLDYTGPVDQPIELDAGTWRITPFGTADGYTFDAINVWSRTEGCDANGENCTNGWRWRLNIWDQPNGAGTSILSISTSLFSTADAALGAAQAMGPFEFSIASAETLYFFFSDSNYSDNTGGISFDISPVQATSVPAPATIALLVGGLAGLLWSRRRQDSA